VSDQCLEGFTLIEILIAVAILVILIIIPVPAFRFFQKTVDLNNARDEIISTLDLSRTMTTASEGAAKYGVYFDKVNGKYILFKGNSYQARNPDFDKIYTLPSLVEISEINLKLTINPDEPSNEVVFNRITGTANQTGNLILKQKLQSPETRTIYVLASGKIVTEIPAVSENQRKKDSRHTHFNLGWSIQNATVLKFKFLSPQPNQIETVDMANYFNAEKTLFDWSGKFTVNNIDQEFRIHTHLLDSANTLLCIHRDRNSGKNTEEVVIYIVDGVDKEIAHYFADKNDTMQKGEIYVSSIEIQ